MITRRVGGRWLRVGSLAVVAGGSICRIASATDYYVDPAGKGALGNGTRTYTTLTAALISSGSVPNGASASNPNRVLIYPGTYTEDLGGTDPASGSSINISKSNVDLIGMGVDPSQTVFNFNKNANTVKPGGTVGTTGSASTRLGGNNVVCANLTFANTSGYGTGQAVALQTTGDQIAFTNCRFTGYQDTLYTRGGRDYFTNCYVTGTVDYIFGDGTAVFDGCTLNNSSSGTVTAANTPATSAIGYVFRNCTLTKQAFSYGGGVAAPPSAPGTNSVQLGRPWQYNGTPTPSDASTLFLNSKFDTHIGGGASGDGVWNRWDSPANTSPQGDTRYAEAGNTNLAGVAIPSSAYASWSHVLAPGDLTDSSGNTIFSLDHIFGPATYWNTLTDQSGQTWRVSGSSNNIWGPLNTSGSNQMAFIDPSTQYTNANFTLGGTWDPTVQLATVPEPGTMLSLGAMSLLMIRRRRIGGR